MGLERHLLITIIPRLFIRIELWSMVTQCEDHPYDIDSLGRAKHHLIINLTPITKHLHQISVDCLRRKLLHINEPLPLQPDDLLVDLSVVLLEQRRVGFPNILPHQGGKNIE